MSLVDFLSNEFAIFKQSLWARIIIKPAVWLWLHHLLLRRSSFHTESFKTLRWEKFSFHSAYALFCLRFENGFFSRSCFSSRIAFQALNPPQQPLLCLDSIICSRGGCSWKSEDQTNNPQTHISYLGFVTEKPATSSGQRNIWKFSEYFGKGFPYSEGLFLSLCPQTLEPGFPACLCQPFLCRPQD